MHELYKCTSFSWVSSFEHNVPPKSSNYGMRFAPSSLRYALKSKKIPFLRFVGDDPVLSNCESCFTVKLINKDLEP